MQIGICASPEELRDFASLDYVEANVQSFLVPQQDEAAFAARREAAKACPAPISAANCFLPGGMKSTGPAVDDAALDVYAQTAFRRAAQVGINIIVFGSGGSRQVPAGWDHARATDQLVRFLGRVGPWAADQGVTLVLEPLNRDETNIVNTLDEGLAIVQAVNAPGVRLLADLYHMLREEETPEALRRAGRWLSHTHLAEKANRTPPGIAGDDFRPFLAVLKEIGFDDRMSLECRWENLPAQLAPAAGELRRQMGQA